MTAPGGRALTKPFLCKRKRWISDHLGYSKVWVLSLPQPIDGRDEFLFLSLEMAFAWMDSWALRGNGS